MADVGGFELKQREVAVSSSIGHLHGKDPGNGSGKGRVHFLGRRMGATKFLAG